MSPSPAPWLVLATVISCKGCMGCWEPSIPDPPDPVGGDTGTVDTGETAVEDTAPPPPCDVPETEPNDTLAEPDDVPLESEACGGFTTEGDFDWIRFPEEDAEWITLVVRAGEVGSRANVVFTIYDEDLSTSAWVRRSIDSQDPSITFPTFGAGSYLVWMWEQDNAFGDDYGWSVRPTEDKPPVSWNAEESEPNGAAAQADAVEPGDVVFGFFDEPDDFDWYRIDVPAGTRDWTFRIEAKGSGSPVNVNLVLYGPDIVDDPDADWLIRGYTDESLYDADAVIRYLSEEATTWYLVVLEDTGRGGPWFWYTLEVASEATDS